MQTLFKSVDISILVLFRIAFGVLGCADVLGTILHNETRHELANTHFTFKYYGFGWIQPLPEWAWLVFAVIMAILGLMIAVGYRYRLTTVAFAVGFTYFNFSEATQYLNHGYLFCWLSWVMVFLPANRCLSYDVKRQVVSYSDTTATWHVWLLAALMGIVYFYGGLAKINTDWLNAQPLLIWLESKKNYFLIGPLVRQDWVAWVMSYGGLALDLFAVPLLLYKPTRPFIFVCILGFHFVNTLIFQIGIFPLLSVALTLCFFPPDLPRKLFYRFFPKYKRDEYHDNYTAKSSAQRKCTTAVLALVMSFHLLMPLRHHLIEGNPAWTEEGHRYSWRMMLRGKSVSGYLLIKDTETGQETRHYATKELTRRQRRKMRANPELILQYAHYQCNKHIAEGKKVEIYAHIKAGLNGRKKQPFTDSSVDLCREEYPFFGHADWILPME